MMTSHKQELKGQVGQGGWVMKRAFAVCAGVLVLGAAGFSFGLTGSWSTEIDVLPALGLEETSLTLTYSVAGWEITSKSVITRGGGYEEQLFQLAGMLAFVDVSGLMVFDPMVPSYKRAFLRASMDLLGVGLGLGWYHGTGWDEEDPGIGEELWLGWEHPDVAGRLGTPFALNHLAYLSAYESAVVLDVGLDPFYGQLVLTDADRYALGFHKITGLVEDQPLCCGITFDVQLTFTKAGFGELKLGLNDLFTLMDLFTADVLITYGVDSKSVAVSWDVADFPVVGCLEVLADVTFSPMAVALQGFGITCVLGDCNEIFFGTAFSSDQVVFEQGESYTFAFDEQVTIFWVPSEDITGPGVTVPVNWGLRSGWLATRIGPDPQPSDPPPPPANPWEVWDLLYWLEYEVIALRFCGPGCCGADYEVGIAFYWAEVYSVDMQALWGNNVLDLTQVFPTLLGLSRISGAFSVPVMANLLAEARMGFNLITEETELSIGWTFTF